MKTIPLSRGLVAFVDDGDYEELSEYQWHADSYGYAVRNIPHPVNPGKTFVLKMHRVIMGLEYGDASRVDHEDENKTNNQRYNLRSATHAQNQRNRSKQANNTSGFKGVSWHRKNSLWEARIKVDGKRKHLGYFRTAEMAHGAYCRAVAELHGEFANNGNRK